MKRTEITKSRMERYLSGALQQSDIRDGNGQHCEVGEPMICLHNRPRWQTQQVSRSSSKSRKAYLQYGNNEGKASRIPWRTAPCCPLRRFWSTRMEHRRLAHRRLERKRGAQSDVTQTSRYRCPDPCRREFEGRERSLQSRKCLRPDRRQAVWL
jgi:hypothetical protein